MKTAATIAEQEERKSAENDRDSSRANTQPIKQKRPHGDFSRIAAWAWKPGQSGNPNGRPKRDMAKEIAEAIFLNNPEMIYQAYSKMLRRGNAYAFQVLADRAFGKLKERVEIDRGPYGDLSEEQLLRQIADLERKLGFTPQPSELPASDDSGSKSKPN